MAVTLEWARDNYDTDKNRLISKSERDVSANDWEAGTITMAQHKVVQEAYDNQTLLPAYDITCDASGCALLLHYDYDKNGDIGAVDVARASNDLNSGSITTEEYNFILKASTFASINALCPGCYGTPPTPPPNMETRTMELTEGSHTIQVSLTGYNTLNATINVSSTRVTCTAGPCNTTGPPGVMISGLTVTTYLKTGTVSPARCTWVATKDTSKVVFISEMVLAYNNLTDIGFTPTAAEIGNAVLMYSNLGTPSSLWGC